MKKQSGNSEGWKRRLARAAAWSTGCLVLLGAAACWGLPWAVELPELKEPEDRMVLDRHGDMLGIICGEDSFFCQPLPEGDLPRELVLAFLAAEDKRFFSHGGVDLLATLRAVWGQLTGQSRSGASTITMQLIKISSPPAERNARTKLKEILQARRLEMSMSKEDILRAYLNRAEFSNRCRGVETAARFYFGKPAAQLSRHEAALLAGLVKAPSRLNPLRHPDRATRRRDLVLERMGEAVKPGSGLGLTICPLELPVKGWEKAGQSTLDATLQRDCLQLAQKELRLLRERNVSQAAIVVLDNRSGEVLVRIGAAFPESSRGGALDGTATPRSVGSTLKPFVYLLAFRNGASPCTVLADVPTQYRSPDGIQAPGNYHDIYLGPVTIRQALACSQNVPAMEALNYYSSIPECLELLRQLNIRLPGNENEYGLGLAIGNAHISLLRLTAAYSALARGGNLADIHEKLPHPVSKGKQVMDALHCYQMTDILSDQAARAATFGTRSPLNLPFPCAAKTGTSSNFRDNWCLGYTADYTVGVWVGNFDNSAMREVSGISGAAPIFRAVMTRLYRNRQVPMEPARPDGLKLCRVDTRNGAPVCEQTPAASIAAEWLTQEQIAELPPQKLDAQGRAILPARYKKWYSMSGAQHLFVLDTAAADHRKPAILTPSDGAHILLNVLPGAPSQELKLLSTLPEDTVQWNSSSLRTYRRGDSWYATLTPGTHTITAFIPGQSELAAQATITVTPAR